MVFYILLLSLSLVACQPSISNAPNSTLQIAASELKPSCGLPWEEGFSLASKKLPEADIQKSFFGKKIDMAKLKQVFNLSAKETAVAIRLSHVDVYQVSGVPLHGAMKQAQQDCHLFSALPKATVELEEEWVQVDPSGLKNLGLFLTSWQAELRNIKNPVILVRSTTDRWTLIHEYVHFLFYEQREHDHQSDADLIPSFLEAFKKFEDTEASYLNDDLSNEEKIEQIQQWIEVMDKYSDLLLNYTLEEVAVESLLNKHYTSHELKNVASDSPTVARKNIQSFSKKSLALIDLKLEEIKRTATQLQILKEQNYLVDDEILSVKSIESLYLNWKKEVHSLNKLL